MRHSIRHWLIMMKIIYASMAYGHHRLRYKIKTQRQPHSIFAGLCPDKCPLVYHFPSQRTGLWLRTYIQSGNSLTLKNCRTGRWVCIFLGRPSSREQNIDDRRGGLHRQHDTGRRKRNRVGLKCELDAMTFRVVSPLNTTEYPASFIIMVAAVSGGFTTR